MELNGCLKIMIFHFVDTIALSCKTNNEIKQLAIQTYHDLDTCVNHFNYLICAIINNNDSMCASVVR